MAKKSAKSKGYRKQIAKKPYLSRKDIIILCLLLAVVAVGAILLFTYDDGALKVKDGKIVDPGENWLVVNGNTRGGRRYFKLGEIGDIEGYTVEPQPFVTDENLTQYVFTPDSEDSAVNGITVSASAYDPARLAEANSKMVASVKGSTVSDIATDQAGDTAYTYYTYTREYEAESEADTEASDAPEDAEPNRFEQAMNAYVDAPRSGSIVISITADADSADGYLTEDQLKDALGQAIAAVILETGN